jgi:hypothetical protein
MLKLILEPSDDADDVLVNENTDSDLTYSDDADDVSPYICSTCLSYINTPTSWLSYDVSPTAKLYFCKLDCMLRDSKLSPRTKAREKATLAQTLTSSNTCLKTIDVEQMRIETDKDVESWIQTGKDFFKISLREKAKMDFIAACYALRPGYNVI